MTVGVVCGGCGELLVPERWGGCGELLVPERWGGCGDLVTSSTSPYTERFDGCGPGGGAVVVVVAALFAQLTIYSTHQGTGALYL